MTTIKELAREAGVSPSTVSIVLSGKSDERKIPLVTQNKVWEAARKLDYQPNVTARRLRIRPSQNIIIAVFWASDFRANMMVRFLRGLQEGILKSKKKCEFVILPYDNGALKESFTTLEMYNAAIICNASSIDMAYLENNSFPVPIVLYNRHSKKYCTVNVDDTLLGAIPAEIFAARGHKNAVILTSDSVFTGMDVRIHSFEKKAQESGLSVQKVNQENSMRGGYDGGKLIAKMSPLPDCIFCLSDFMAIGSLRAFHQEKIAIPENLELISIGNGDRELEEYASISLSVVHLPMERMAEACLELTLALLARSIEPPHSIKLPIEYRCRESCGGFPDSKKAIPK
jgi:LacI family transcriptional regulator